MSKIEGVGRQRRDTADSGSDSDRDMLATQPTVFAPGEDRLSMKELRALAPQDDVWRKRSVGLSEALIMMVDDEMLNIEMTQAFLADAGYRHFVNTDQPEHAVPMMRKDPPGVLLLDLSMPKVSGLDILAAMREDGVLRHVPAIVLTSSTDPQVKLKALALGAMDFLSKPVDPSELALRIRNTLAASAYREYLGQHDGLTGLPNKQRYRKDMAAVLAEALGSGHPGALIHVGVDNLGRINDALGRSVGDQLLQRVAKRLASCVQTEHGGELCSEQHNPSLYRFDGDEFAIVVPFMEGVPSAAFINKLLEDSTVSFQRTGFPELFVTCSVGVSVFPNDGTEPDVLMRNAGLALRHAKLAGPHRYEFFSPQFKEMALSRLDLSAELRHAVSRDEIELLYEPRVELASGRVVAGEAVLRWKHASGRIIEGDELMDLAGSSEMDVVLSEWLFEMLMKHMKNWRSAGLQAVPIAVKVSLANMRPSDLVHLVSAAITNGVDARQLSLELQQVSALDNLPAKEAAAIAGLRKKGVRIALGRFGGASASISHLRQLPCDEILPDASFLRDVERDATAQAMLLAVSDVARRLKLPCVACGVETAQQLAFLKKNGFEQGQGRYFGEAATGLAFAAKWLTRGGRPVRISMPDALS